MQSLLQNSWLRILSLCACVPLSAVPAQTLAEFNVPSGASIEAKVEVSVAVTTEIRGELGKVTVSEDPAAAAEGAAQALIDTGEGVQLFAVGSGVGVLAAATADYDAEVRDARRLHIARRSARMVAALRARRLLMEYQSGLSASGTTAFASAMVAVDAEDERYAATCSAMAERLRTDSSGLVRGATVYRVEDRPESGEVFVALLCTPKSLAVSEHRAGASVFAGPEEARAWLERELSAGTLPPDGAYRVELRSTGSTHWIGVGSQTALSSSSVPKLQKAARRSARRHAKSQAQKALVTALQGGRIAASDHADEAFAEHASSLDDLLSEDNESEQSSIAAASSSEQVSAAFGGEVPPGAVFETLESVDGVWVYSIGFYPALPMAAQSAAAPAPAPRAPVSAVQASAPALPQDPVGVPSCQSDPDSGVERALITSSHPDRRIALKTALLEGIERVNGVKLKGSSAVKEQYRDAITDLNGKLEQVVEMESSSKDEVYTEANGLIQDFKVLKEGKNAAGEWELQVCVSVPVFDPARPRPGKRATVAIVPSVAAPGLRELAEELAGEVMQGLVGLEGYTILERRHLQSIKKELASFEAGVASGSMKQVEMLKIGQELGADYLLVGDLRALESKQWQVRNKVTNRQEPRASLAINSGVRLVSVATSEAVVASEFEDTWDFMRLVREGPKRGESEVKFAMRQAVTTHLAKVREFLAAQRLAATPRVLFVDGTEAAMETSIISGFQVGQVLTVYGVRKIKSKVTGKVREIKSKKGVIKITRIDTGESLLYGEIVSGKVDEGDACQRS